MKRLHRNQKGIAAVEMALGLIVLVPLLLLLVEASKALTEYSQLQNAAMEGARMLARQNGDATGVADYIKNTVLTDASGEPLLGGAEPAVTISPRDAQNDVTVQVDHDYSPLFTPQYDSSGAINPFSLFGSNPLTISAKTTMALPAAN